VASQLLLDGFSGHGASGGSKSALDGLRPRQASPAVLGRGLLGVGPTALPLDGEGERLDDRLHLFAAVEQRLDRAIQIPELRLGFVERFFEGSSRAGITSVMTGAVYRIPTTTHKSLRGAVGIREDPRF
jgi:hypothetical protein